MFGPRKQTVGIWAAILLPVLILIGLQLYLLTNEARRDVERLSAARAHEIAAIAEARAIAEMTLVTVLASSASLPAADIAETYRLAGALAAASGIWKTVSLADPSTGVERFDLRRPLSSGPMAMSRSATAAAAGVNRPTIGGVEPDGAGGFAVMLRAPVIRDGVVRYVVTVGVDPSVFHATVAARASAGSVVAVVDRSGKIIARSLDHNRRLGHPASRFVRQAVARGGNGLYRGVTLDGLANYTAYVTAPTTGWSAHVAVPSRLIDGPRRLSFVIWGVVAAGCLLISGLIIWLILRDMGLRRQEEQRLQQAQKMEAVGQLTGGIAHDFNNLLTAIIGGLDIVLKRSAADAPNRRYLEGALDAAVRGAKLTSRLLAFSRSQRLALEAVDVEAVIADMSELLAQSLGPGITVKVQVAPDARWVTTDKNQLELALLNLAVNARDAMPEGGTLEFSTRAVGAENPRASAHRVEITVADNGQGMPRDVAARAFDPFFTTKDVNRGTGLGLAQVYAMAKQSGGGTHIESVPGQGTRVSLLLPPATPVETAPRDVRPDAPINAGAGQTVLVVDDDDSVRRIVVETLRDRGFVVSETGDGGMALAQLAHTRPDLLIIDFLMPGLNGAAVALKARELDPTQKVLFVSGYMDTDAIDAALPNAPVLRKPFDGDQLVAAVREVLDGSPAGRAESKADPGSSFPDEGVKR